MTIEMIAALCTGIVSIVTAIGAVFITIYNRKLIIEEGAKKDEKLEQIHVLVNSRLTKALDRIELLEQFINKDKASPKSV